MDSETGTCSTGAGVFSAHVIHGTNRLAAIPMALAADGTRQPRSRRS